MILFDHDIPLSSAIAVGDSSTKSGAETLRAFALLVILALTGCGTTRMTDTKRAASEMMLISQAVDTAIGQIDFSALHGKDVYLDTQYLDGVVDKGYVISTMRNHLIANGALLMDTRDRAEFIVEARAGVVGTDTHSLLVGTPQMNVPTSLVSGVPTTIPELAFIKKTEQKGVAKIAAFAYRRETGRAVWQSGSVDSDSTLKDTWVFGAGPFSRGSIRRNTELAGEPLPELPSLPSLPNPFASKPEVEPVQILEPAPIIATRPITGMLPHAWDYQDPYMKTVLPSAAPGLTGPAALVNDPVEE